MTCKIQLSRAIILVYLFGSGIGPSYGHSQLENQSRANCKGCKADNGVLDLRGGSVRTSFVTGSGRDHESMSKPCTFTISPRCCRGTPCSFSLCTLSTNLPDTLLSHARSNSLYHDSIRLLPELVPQPCKMLGPR